MSVVPSHPSMHPSAEWAASMTKLFQPMFTCDKHPDGEKGEFVPEVAGTIVQQFSSSRLKVVAGNPQG